MSLARLSAGRRTVAKATLPSRTASSASESPNASEDPIYTSAVLGVFVVSALGGLLHERYQHIEAFRADMVHDNRHRTECAVVARLGEEESNSSLF